MFGGVSIKASVVLTGALLFPPAAYIVQPSASAPTLYLDVGIFAFDSHVFDFGSYSSTVLI